MTTRTLRRTAAVSRSTGEVQTARDGTASLDTRLNQIESGQFHLDRYGSRNATGLQAAIDAAEAAGGGRVMLGAGTISFAAGGTVRIDSDNVTVEGVGHDTDIQIPANTAADVIEISGADNVTLRNFKITRTGTPTSASLIWGVVITAGATNVLCENVYIDGCARGFQIGEDGTTECTDITLRNCTTTHSTTATANSSVFGICVDDAARVTLDNCTATAHWLDGLKLRTNSRDVHIIGGVYKSNGVSGAGNGLDAYYGGEQLTITGGYYGYNDGSGIYIKTGDENASGGGGAKINNITITGPTCEYNSGGAGLDLNRNTAGSTTQPLVCHVTVNGGQYNNNGEAGGTGSSADVGIYIRARNVTLNGVACKRNERQGIVIVSQSFNVTISNPIIISNGRKTANTYPGLDIDGDDVTVIGGIYDGKDADYIAQESDLSGETAYHNYGIFVNANASGVRVIQPVIKNSGVSTGFAISGSVSSGVVHIERTESGVTPESNRYGGPGSIFIRSDNGYKWIKRSGYGVTGWRQIHPHYFCESYAVASLPAASSYTGAIAYASNGRKAGEGVGAGTGVLIFSDGANWIAVDTGATVAA